MPLLFYRAQQAEPFTPSAVGRRFRSRGILRTPMELGYTIAPKHNFASHRSCVITATLALATVVVLAAINSGWVNFLFQMDDVLAVHAIQYGTSAFPENLVFADGDPNSSLARFGWLCYAIRYGSDPWIGLLSAVARALCGCARERSGSWAFVKFIQSCLPWQRKKSLLS